MEKWGSTKTISIGISCVWMNTLYLSVRITIIFSMKAEDLRRPWKRGYMESIVREIIKTGPIITGFMKIICLQDSLMSRWWKIFCRQKISELTSFISMMIRIIKIVIKGIICCMRLIWLWISPGSVLMFMQGYGWKTGIWHWPIISVRMPGFLKTLTLTIPIFSLLWMSVIIWQINNWSVLLTVSRWTGRNFGKFRRLCTKISNCSGM